MGGSKWKYIFFKVLSIYVKCYNYLMIDFDKLNVYEVIIKATNKEKGSN